MRWIAFLLLASNLLVLGLNATNPAHTVDQQAAVESWSGSRRLQRISELTGERLPQPRKPLPPDALPQGTDSGAQVAEVISPEGSTAAGLTCRAWSFSEEKTALSVKAALEATGLSVDEPRPERIDHLRYWVLLPPFKSDTKARLAIERLKAAGVRDYYLIPGGENKDALSLGLFHTREAAQRLVLKVAPLNLKVRVEEVSFPSRRFVLEVHGTSVITEPNWANLLSDRSAPDAAPCELKH